MNEDEREHVHGRSKNNGYARSEGEYNAVGEVEGMDERKDG